MADKPLHVQVAEALGLSAEPIDDGPRNPPAWFLKNSGNLVPRYDSDWSATGPLIEKLHISIMDEAPKWKAMVGASDAYEGLDCDDYATGPTPLLAVCHLILQLHKTAKLPTNV